MYNEPYEMYIYFYPMNWTVAEARRRFAEVLDRARRSPQPIYRRGQLVGAVVAPEQLEAVRAMLREERKESLSEALSRLRAIVTEEGYELSVPKRLSRRVPRLGQ